MGYLRFNQQVAAFFFFCSFSLIARILPISCTPILPWLLQYTERDTEENFCLDEPSGHWMKL